MKFYETHFEEYLLSNQKKNLHTKLQNIINKFPKNISDLKNIIFYGPEGVGKYTQVLKTIKKYSPSELKYEKKITITFNKQPYYIKISDIHYEVDMSLLGCNAKLLWHEIYQHVIDIIMSRQNKRGIIVCKNFHEINSELLENFYSYMQQQCNHYINITIFLITEEISFIPDNILNSCEIINIVRPSKNAYNKILKSNLSNNYNIQNINNIKNVHNSIESLNHPYKILCNSIIYEMLNVENINFLKFRVLLYDIFIYNLDITDCIWYILSVFINKNKIKNTDFDDILIKTYNFLQYYNNNYRPIYHIEKYLFFLISKIHNF